MIEGNARRTSLVILLAMSFRVAIDELYREYDRIGFADMRPVHGFTLEFLADNGWVTGNDIADYLSITKQAASTILNHLEQNEYIIRKDHPEDRRSKLVGLSDKGRSVLTQAANTFGDIQTQLIAVIGESRMHDLREDLIKIVNHLSSSEGLPPFRPVW